MLLLPPNEVLGSSGWKFERSKYPHHTDNARYTVVVNKHSKHALLDKTTLCRESRVAASSFRSIAPRQAKLFTYYGW